MQENQFRDEAFFEQFEILFESFPRSHSSPFFRSLESTGFVYQLGTMSIDASHSGVNFV
jgi:hypothetical protein